MSPAPITSSSITCDVLSPNYITLERSTFIAALTTCVLITLLSLTALAIIALREHNRRKRDKSARDQGRKSRYVNRISTIRKEVDTSFSSQYNGCLYVEPENPYLQPQSPVETQHEEWPSVFEVPAVPAVPTEAARVHDRDRKGRSLVFDGRKGQWFPRR
ncbi:hypothetical protein B0A48_15041 [Cryoendolithus antarcticus]|uniref:Uncharacterized protein n=1 Tax=Cryoendolithus antarcticus TaxID=1507870 RepID=A0A1V8SJ83_9PEZI|nr:hypothetical protein B0A48_15041 [Cryoendolithus antarcticus]